MASRSGQSAAERGLYSRAHRILTEPGLIRGSLVVMKKTCGNPTCRCARDKKARHQVLYVSANIGTKRAMMYVPRGWEDRVREWVDRHRRLRDALEELSLTYIRRLKEREE